MLHTETVEPGSLAILKRLMKVPSLQGFALVGGTALSLRYGHRKSVDLDLFSFGDFEKALIQEQLTREFGNDFTFRREQANWSLFSMIGDLKLDIIKDPQPRISTIEVVEGIRFYMDDDIAPMKIEAILHRAAKKDFWDLEVLLQKHGLEWILAKHQQRYPDNSIGISIPYAITWFKDAEESQDPVSLNGQTWEGVKESIGQYVNGYVK